MYLLFSFGCSSEPVRPFVSSLKYRFLWKIEYLPILYIRNFISCTDVSTIFFWMFVTNQCGCAWVPWSIDSFEKYSNFVYFICIISSHLRMYLLFSFGWSGEPVRPFASSLKYRFLWKIEYLPILYIRNIISCTDVSTIFFWMFVRTSVAVAWVPWSIDSFEKYSNFVYLICIISSHLRMYLLFSLGCSGEPIRLRVCSLKYKFLWKILYLRVLYLHIIISSTHVSAIFFWMFGRTSPAIREFPEV